ncbi:hypothetical protein SDC9_104757 [bioreactor metagenome]|uniref:Uncharacterized protein n=1 Tax=bioreactor metagenome TaxID=1076179 RepID=A0A645AYS3_9ZZZZ
MDFNFVLVVKQNEKLVIIHFVIIFGGAYETELFD